MQAPISSHLRTLLQTYIDTTDWALYTAVMPDTPDKVVLVTDTAGRDPNPRYLLDYPGAQILVRGSSSDYVATNLIAHNAKDVLLGIESQDVGGDRIVAINMLADVGFIGRDDRMRPTFTFNLAMIVEPAATAQTNRVAL